MNKKISFPIALIIIVVLVTLVGGLAVWQYFWAPKIEISEFKPAEKTQSEDETADWKTYRNEEYGYEMKYPKDWLVYELVRKEWVTFIGNEWVNFAKGGTEPGIFRAPWERERIDIVVHELTPDFQKWIEEELAASITKKEIEVGLGNYKGWEAQSSAPMDGELNLRVIFLPPNYTIRMDADGSVMVIFDKMLSTFRFLE